MKLRDIPLRIKEEIRERHFWKGVRCEFLGTFIYVLFGCMATVTWRGDPSDSLHKVMKISMTFGLVETLLVSAFSHSSGSLFNPVLTLVMGCMRFLHFFKAFCFLVAQLTGAIVASAVLYGIAPSYAKTGLALNSVHSDISEGQAFGVEFLSTFVFVLAYLLSLNKSNDVAVPNSVSCGIAVTVAHLFAVEATGCGVNPARSLGPAIVLNAWRNHWIYWVGPMLGGIIGAFTFEYTRDCSVDLQDLRKNSEQFIYSLQPKDDTQSRNSLTDVQMEQTEVIDEL